MIIKNNNEKSFMKVYLRLNSNFLRSFIKSKLDIADRKSLLTADYTHSSSNNNEDIL